MISLQTRKPVYRVPTSMFDNINAEEFVMPESDLGYVLQALHAYRLKVKICLDKTGLIFDRLHGVSSLYVFLAV